MFGYLRGRPFDFDLDRCLLDVGGVGYEVFATSQTLESIQGQSLVTLRIYTHIREDVLQLFGFLKSAEKELFLSLNKVTGIGPKMAMQIMSGARFEDIMEMIDQGDAAGLSKLPRIGKKKAEQIVLALKGKLVQLDEPGTDPRYPTRSEIFSALVNLGFKSSDVEVAVKELDPKIDVEQGVREGLQRLTQL